MADDTTLTEAHRVELQWLRFFWKNVKPALGPSDSDIICDICNEFEEKTGKKVPQQYDWRE